MTTLFKTAEEAKKAAKCYRKQHPGLKFQVNGFPVGNKMLWEVIQVNRFSE